MFCFTFQKWYTEWIHSTDIWCTSHQYLRTIPPFCTWDQKVHVAKIFTFYQSGDTYGISWYSVKKSHLWLHSGAPHHCSSFSSFSVCPPISIFNSSLFSWYWTGFAHGAATISSDKRKRRYERTNWLNKDRYTKGISNSCLTRKHDRSKRTVTWCEDVARTIVLAHFHLQERKSI